MAETTETLISVKAYLFTITASVSCLTLMTRPSYLIWLKCITLHYLGSLINMLPSEPVILLNVTLCHG